MNKYKKVFKSIKFISGLLVVIAGIGIMLLGNSVNNPMVIVLGLGMAGAGGFLIKSSFSVDERQLDLKKEDKQALSNTPPNAVVIRRHSVGFENVYNPPGQTRKCYNDGNFYHELIEVKGKLVEFLLPDTEEEEVHYDPAEFANVVTMPLNGQYFAWKDDLFQKISMAIMAVIIGAEIIALIVFAG